MNNALKLGLLSAGTATFVASTILFLRHQTKAVEDDEGRSLEGNDDEGSRSADDEDEEEPATNSDAEDAPIPMSEDLEWTDLLPLPTADDVEGDLEANWGSTPVDLRPLFLFMEEQAGIPGAGRIFSVIAYGESRWVTTAHNGDGDAEREEAERAASRRAYDRYKSTRPPLRFGEEAADFGSGGLFGALAPFFLWTGIVETKQRAPLLRCDPRIMFLPRVAGFAACVYLMRLLRYYTIDDVFDIKAGWASPSLLVGERRTSATTKAVRSKFSEHATAVGIDLVDAATVPSVLSVAAFPGVLELFEAMVGEPHAGQEDELMPQWTDILGCYDPELNPLADLVGDFDARSATEADAWRITQWRHIARSLGWSDAFEGALQLSSRPSGMASATELAQPEELWRRSPTGFTALAQAAVEAFTQTLARRQQAAAFEDFDRARVRHQSLQALEAIGAEEHSLFLVSAPSTRLPSSGCYELAARGVIVTPAPPQSRTASVAFASRESSAKESDASESRASVGRLALDQLLGLPPTTRGRRARAFRAARAPSFFHPRHPLQADACVYPVQLSLGTFPWVYGSMLDREAPGLSWETGRPWRPAALGMQIMASLWADPAVNLRQDARRVAAQYRLFRDETNALLEGVPVWTEGTRGAVGQLYRRAGYLYVHQGSAELVRRVGVRGTLSASAYNYVKRCFAVFFCARRSYARAVASLPSAARSAFSSNPDPCAQQQLGRRAVSP